MSTEYLDDQQNLADLVTFMPKKEREQFGNYGHLRIEAAFVNRLFIVYRSTGLTASKQYKEPEILTTIKVFDFAVDPRGGSRVVIEDLQTLRQLNITHVPCRLFTYPVYMSVPPRVTLHWDARLVAGKVSRSLSFAVLIKTRNKSDFYSKGNIYVETPNTFKSQFPSFNEGIPPTKPERNPSQTKIMHVKRDPTPRLARPVKGRGVQPASAAIPLTPLYGQALFSEAGRTHVPPPCYLERELESGQWVTDHSYGRKLTVEQARNVAHVLPSYRVVVRDPNGNYEPDNSGSGGSNVANSVTGVVDSHLPDKRNAEILSFNCPECHSRLPNSLPQIVHHLETVHGKTISAGEANRIATRSNLQDAIPYTEGDHDGKIPGEVNGGAMFTKRRKY